MRVPNIGDAVGRIDGADKARGLQVYPSDYRVDGMTRVHLLRSAHAHARILSIDTAAAGAADGVVGVFTASDVPGRNAVGVVRADGPVLVGDIARCTGDVLAMVVAETAEQARAACDLIDVQYEPLPAVTDPHEALAADAPKVHAGGNLQSEIHHHSGDVEAAFAAADHVFTGEFRTGRQEHIPMETEAGVAFYDEEGVLTVRHGGQYPHRDAQQIAAVLGVQEHEVRVLTPMVGGSFGGKDDFTVQCYLALATHLTKRPCHIMLDRSESISATPKRHPYHNSYKIACNRDGRLQAATIRMVSDTGAHASWGEIVLYVSTETCLGPYHIPNVQLDAYCVYTNNCISGAFRGFGGLQGAVGIECLMDEMARELGVDPIEIRRINALEPGGAGPSGIDFNADDSSLDRVLTEVQNCDLYRNREELRCVAPEEGPWKVRGVGIASSWMGVGYGHGVPDSSEAIVELTDAGTYLVRMGGVDMGQGNATAFAQIAASELNCSVDQVDVVLGDSAGPDSGSCDSVRTMYVMSASLLRAVKDLSDQIRESVAAKLDCSPADIEIEEDAAHERGSDNTVPLGSLGSRIGRGAIRIYQEDESDNTDNYDKWVFTYGAQAVLVEVDLLTGRVEVLRVFSAVDAGKVINRQGFEAQSEGGIVQSIGYALTEDCISHDGHIMNTGLSTYVVPYILDVPDSIETVAVECSDPQTPYGAKGIAEIVMIPTPPAILNAVRDATGERFTELPLTAERVLARLGDVA